jgi:hypothetical protein
MRCKGVRGKRLDVGFDCIRYGGNNNIF